MQYNQPTKVDFVNRGGISIFMFTDDSAYKLLPESCKHYSLIKHTTETKAEKYQHPDYWRRIQSGSLISTVFVRIMNYYWENIVEDDFSIVDVGSQYGNLSLTLGKYIKTSGHSNRIYAFDCGIAGKLTEYNIKVNELDDIIKFEYKAVSNVSIPHLVYFNSEHSEDNHVVRRNFIDLPSYVVDGITLDDYFKNDTKNLMIKIDTQGAEPLVFDGMGKILTQRHSPPIIIFEFIPWVCKTIKDPVQFLDSLPKEYILLDMGDTRYTDNEHGNLLKGIKSDAFEDFVNKISRKSPQYTDLLLLHERVQEVLETKRE